MSDADPDENRFGTGTFLTVPWFVVGVLIGTFLVVAVVAMGANSLALDVWVTHQVQRWQNPRAQMLADAGNILGSKGIGLGFIAGAGLVFAALIQWRACGFILALGVGRLLATQLKGIFESPRPHADQVAVTGSFEGWGFPSGHVTGAAVTLGAVAWIIARYYPQIDRRLIGTLWMIGVVWTAWARVYVGAHWFTDTVGGTLIGVILVMVATNLSFTVTQRWRPGDQR